MVHRLSDVYPTIGAPVVLGEGSGGLSRPRTMSTSAPDGPKKRFEKFPKKSENLEFSFFFKLRKTFLRTIRDTHGPRAGSGKPSGDLSKHHGCPYGRVDVA